MGFLFGRVVRVFLLSVWCVAVAVAAQAQSRPSTVDLGPDRTAVVGDVVVLRAEIDNPAEYAFEALWSSGRGVGIVVGPSDSRSASVTITPEMAGTTITVQVTVRLRWRDEVRETVSDDVRITVAAKGGPSPEDQIAAFFAGRINNLMSEQPDLAAIFDGVPGGGPGITASSMGDAVAVTTGMGGPVWAEIRGSRSRLAGAPGDYVLGAVGMHWQVGEGSVLGVMAMADRARSGVAGGPIEGTGWLAGPYVVLEMPGQPLVFQARYLAGDSKNRLADGSRFASKRSLAVVQLSGSIERAGVEIVPSLRASYGREVAEAFTDGSGTPVPSLATDLAQVETGIAVNLPVDLGSGTTRVRFGLSDVWTGGDAGALAGHRAELSVMARHRFASGAELTLSVARDGLGMDGFKATRAAVNYAISF